jgi:cytochrome c556
MTIWFNGTWRERLMMRLVIGAISVIMINSVAIIFMVTLPAKADNQVVIQKRIELMRKDVLGNFKVILAHVKGGKGSMADVGNAAKALEAASGKLLSLFPEGTGRSNYSNQETRSLSKIWDDWATFEKANNAMASQAAAIFEHATDNNLDGIKKSFRIMGKEGCGSCHKYFRGPKAK